MWRELTEDDVLGVLSEPEVAAYQGAATGSGQDVLADILGQVINHCRGYIADNTQNALAAGLTLPERCLRPALHLIRKDLLTRLDLEVSEDRRKDAIGPVQTVTLLSNHERQATRDKLSGL